MRITEVEAISVDGGSRNWVFVRILTDEGIIGIGEATVEWHTSSVVAAVDEIGELLIGEDPSRIEHIWQKMYRGRRFRGGPVVMSAISGLEVALWDIKGKVLNTPIYELLGGSCRESIPVYANAPFGTSRQELVDGALGVMLLGFDALKFCPIHTVLEVDDPLLIREAADTVAAVRAAVGPTTRLAIDVACRLSPAMAIQFARAVEEFDIWFLEEPIRAENPEALALVARATTIPIAAGEQLYTRWNFRELFSRHAVSLVQPDVAHCGGIAETRRVAAMAEISYVGFAPHNPLSPVNTAASAHVAMATPNFVTLEYKVEASLPWLPDAAAPWRDSILQTPLELRDGALRLPRAPGLGVELDLETCRRHPARSRKPTFPQQRDGALAEF